MLGGIGDMFAGIGDAIKSLGQGILDLGNTILNGLVNLGSSIIDGLVSFLKDPLGSIVDGFTSVMDFLDGLVESIVDGFSALFEWLFVPSDDYFDSKFNMINNTLDSKINTTQLSNALGALKGVSPTALTMPMTTVLGIDINLSGFWAIINNNLDMIQMFIRAIFYVYLLNYNINNVYRLIRGSDMQSGGSE